jgi:hypothetical protein
VSQEQRQLNHTDTLDYSPTSSQQIIIPSPFSFTALAFFFFGIVLLLLLIVGIIKNWSLLTASTSVLIQVVIILCVIGLPATLIGVGIQKGYLSWVNMRQAKLEITQRELELERTREEIEDIRQQRLRANEAHNLNLYLLESRIPADERGNRAAIYDRETGAIIIPQSGNFVQPVPNTYSPRIEITTSSTQAEAAAASQLQHYEQPALETIISELVPNSLQFAYGLDPLTGQLVTTTLPKAVHIQLLGASGQGKSRQATSILTQLSSRNDTSHLQLALIDCEGETTAPFQQLPHVRYLADDPREAAKTLRALVGELERRDQTKTIFPVILIFVEEFLNLRRTMPETYRDQALEDYTTLALRGRKRGMFLFAIGQTAYVDRHIRDAQNQFLSSMAFAVKPTAARAAGFTNTELLNRLYADRRPGQFLLERPAGDSILLAPYVDTRTISMLLTNPETTTENDHPIHVVESSLKDSRNQPRNQIDPALQAKLTQVCQLLTSGTTNKTDIILSVWGVKPGSSERYKTAEAEYKQIMTHLALQSKTTQEGITA